ncbi:hypothetical protein SFRURICE_011840 [Spodoptera frugiperda]|nr:hypothetical protein SFRURICE_011840 [Spodoptera frugiperda]
MGVEVCEFGDTLKMCASTPSPLLSLWGKKAEMHIMTRNATVHCTTPTFHSLCCKSHVTCGEPIAIPGTSPDSVLLLRILRKTEKIPAILCPTQKSNSRPFARQSHLQTLGQRGSEMIQ